MISAQPPLRWHSRQWEASPRGWTRLSIAAAVVLLSVVIGIQPSLMTLGALLALSTVSACLRWPAFGLAVVIAAGQVVPFGISTGTQTDLHSGVLLLSLLIGRWVLEMLVRREVKLVPSPAVRPVLALAGVAALGFLVGQRPWLVLARPAPLATQLGGLAIFLLSAGAFLLVGHTVRSVRSLQLVTWVFLALGALFVAGEVARDLGASPLYIFQNGASGSLFWTWLAALAFGQAVVNRSLGLGWRLALAGLTFASLYHGVIYSPDWLSGWLPPLVATAVILCSRSPRLTLLCALAAALLVVLGRETIVDRLSTAGSTPHAVVAPSSGAAWGDIVGAHVDSDTKTRTEIWSALGHIIQLNPLLGLGPANYASYATLFPTSAVAWGYLNISSHNNYIDLVAQTGLLGLACFLWFAASIGWLGWRLRSSVPAGFAQAYVYGALGGLVGSLVAGGLGDWVLPFVYNIGYAGFRASVLGWFFLGGLVALEQIFRSPQPDRA
jgi:hypothetical protein